MWTSWQNMADEADQLVKHGGRSGLAGKTWRTKRTSWQNMADKADQLAKHGGRIEGKLFQREKRKLQPFI
jgi:hypothetical protein